MSRVLIIGGGGREHALAWKLAQSPRVNEVIVAPGNDGMPSDWKRWPADLAKGKVEFERLAVEAKKAKVDLTVVGPDNALADGIVDVFESAGLLCFGPTSGASRIESSKAFAKEVMSAASVPTAKFFIANSFEEASKILRSVPWSKGWVVKADGLALGKGVQVCRAYDHAVQAAESLIRVSGKLVIEEELKGTELSWMAFCDGETCSLLEPARDHKRLLDGDEGPNTGGMGAYSPVPGVDAGLAARLKKEVFQPVLAEMNKRGVPFRGLLYAGLMGEWDRADSSYRVLEFNARFGDPETQALLPRMSDDLYPWCLAVARHDLSQMPEKVSFLADASVFVVAAAEGYPEQVKKGEKLIFESGTSFDPAERGQPRYFSSGVKREGDTYLTAGGRVFGALGMGRDLTSAREEAYRALSRVKFGGKQFRKDIGWTAA